MSEHPIENLMKTAMNSIKEMVDVNTIVGDAIVANNMVIIPVSRVCFGFAAGGTEFCTEKNKNGTIEELPFGGGSGAAVNIIPVGFIIMNAQDDGNTKFLPIEHTDAIDKLLDYVPDLLDRVSKIIEGKNESVHEINIKDKNLQSEQKNKEIEE